MIVKIKTYKKPGFKRLLEYMLNDKERLFDDEGKSFAITHNLKGDSIDGWIKQFLDNEQYRKLKRKDSTRLTHEIISFHKDDAKNISLDKMETMAREYIRLRNPKGIYVAVPHFDKQHYHIHICASGLEYRTGKALRMTKGEFQTLKKNIQLFQQEKFPELSKSIVGHGKKVHALSDQEYQYKLRTGRATEKEQLIGILKTCYKKANSKESFFELLKECKLKIYERGGKISGVYFANKKFRFKRIGFSEERLEELNKSFNRGKELGVAREKKGKNIERNI